MQDGKHGDAWGVLTWRGQAQRPEAPTKINGPLKPVWRVMQQEEQQWTSLLSATLRQERQAAKTAAAEAEAQPAAAAEQTASA